MENIKEMSDREISEETLLLLRAFAATVQAAGQNPMLRAMMPPGLLESVRVPSTGGL